MKYRAILYVISLLLIFLSFGMGISSAVSFIMSDPDALVYRFSGCAAWTFIIGYALCKLTERKRGELDFGSSTRDGFVTVALAWLVAVIFGSLPFITCANLTSYDAFFETASGLTTTGASVINTELLTRDGTPLGNIVESLPHHDPNNLPLPAGLLFWRCLLNWLGGVGIVFFVLLVLPLLKVGRGTQLYNAEVPGLKTDSGQLTPRLGSSILSVTLVYLFFTILGGVLYYYFGMGMFDSVCHALSTIATGGFSNKTASIGYYSSPGIQWSVTAIMFVAACNFSLLLKIVFTGKFPYFADEEFRFFACMVVVSILVITPLVYFSSPEVISVTGDPAFLPRTFSNYLRIVAFQVLTIASTTGFCTSDYELWNCPVAILIICAMMFPCGCGGSTAGGMKCSRLIVVGKHLINEIKHCVYPRTIASVRLSGERIDDPLVAKTLAFVLCYIALFIGVALLLTVTEYRPNARYRQPAKANLVQMDADGETDLAQTQQDPVTTDSTAPTPQPYGITIDVKTAFGASIAALSNIGPGFGHVGPSGDYHWFRPISKIILAITMITGRLELYTILVLFLPSFWRK